MARERKELFEAEDKKEVEFAEGQALKSSMKNHAHHDGRLSVSVRHAVSGHRFRRVHRRANLQLDVFRRTAAKGDWKGDEQPYAALPRMVLLTYQLPDAIREIAMQGEFNEFDLNVFFSAEGEGD